MSKYNALWEYVQKSEKESFKMTFEEIQKIAGIPIDHSFLKYKKELAEYGWQVEKITMKEQTVLFRQAIRGGKEIYYIGGSPCSGKSSVAEILSQKYGLYYFKLDDYLERYMQSGARKGYPACGKAAGMNAEQTWMREPLIQCREELDIYREIFEFAAEDLEKIDWEGGMITEGAGYLPELMKRSGIPGSRYISITPAKEFQILHYRKRDFVPWVLEGCSDKEAAFRNWMDRDALFAQEVQKQCDKEKYVSVINDGTMGIEELADLVAVHFLLEK